MGTHPIFESDFDCLTADTMMGSGSERRLGLSLAKDGGYSKLIVFCSAILSGFTFGLPVFGGVLTGQWKKEYGLDVKTASIHQRYMQAFLYFGNVILCAFYQKLSPQVWLIISCVTGTLGYGIMYAAYWLDFKYFVVCQYLFGILAGLGSGFSFGLICITPQHWLDKTRNKMNPYLFIGAPIFVTAIAPLGQLAVDNLSWSNALLIIIAIFLHQWIITAFFVEHPSCLVNNDGEEKSSPTLKESMKNYVDVLKMDGSLPWLFNCAVCSGFIMSGVFTEVVNIAVESGIDAKIAANLILFSSVPEVLLFRPLWGKLTDYADCGTWQIVWMIVLLLSQVTLALATSMWMWIVGMLLFSCGVSGYSGLKFVLHLDMVGDKHMQYILTFDTLLAAICTIVVPTASNWLAKELGNPKILYWVTSIAALICVFTSVYIRAKRTKNVEARMVAEARTSKDEEEIQLKE